MSGESFIALVNNAALLLAMVFVYDLVAARRRTVRSWAQQLVVGLVLGAIGITVMLTHWEFGSGVVFDTRSVLLCVSELFFGPLPTIVAMLMTAAFRFSQGRRRVDGSGRHRGLRVHRDRLAASAPTASHHTLLG
jgi:hypothetical protein